MTDSLDSMVWVRSSAEFQITTTQLYALAEYRLAEGIFEPDWSAVIDAPKCEECPTAVILDLDETVLDNSGYDAELLARGESFTWESWEAWLDSDRAGEIPGAARFVAAARRAGVEVFFVTNRKERYRASTVSNLEKIGISGADEAHLLMREQREEWGKDKTSRRQWVASTHRVLLLIGDDLNDFRPAIEMTPAARRALVSDHQEKWGRQWFLIPSPVYGTWMEAVIGEELEPEKRRAAKIEAISK